MVSVCLWERERERVWVSVWAFVCVRRFHGNLSGVCLVPGDRERERERWETGRKLSLVKGWGGGGWDKLMGGGERVRWDCLRPSVLPYHPINLLLFIFSNPGRLPFPFPFLASLPLFPCKEISRLAVSVSCHTGGFLGNNQVHKTHLRKSPRHHRFLLT